MLEEAEHTGQPAQAAPSIVAAQTAAEDRGLSVRVKAAGEPLTPARLSLTAIGRLIVMPYCELLSWPLAIVRWIIAPSPKPSAFD